MLILSCGALVSPCSSGRYVRRKGRQGALAVDKPVPQSNLQPRPGTQNTQWLMLMGTSFVVSAYLQVVRGYNAIQTGVIFTAATLGILVSSLAAERLAKRRTQRTLILLDSSSPLQASPSCSCWSPDSNSLGLRAGPAPDWSRSRPHAPTICQFVQSSFAEAQQGEISGLYRSVPTSAPASEPRSRHHPRCRHHRDTRALVRISHGRRRGGRSGRAGGRGHAAITTPRRDGSGRTSAQTVTPTHPERVKPGTRIAGIVALFVDPRSEA